MAGLNGGFYNIGFRVALKGPNDPVTPPSAAQAPAYLHFVDTDGNTLAPELVPDGLQTPAGPLAGLKWTFPTWTPSNTPGAIVRRDSAGLIKVTVVEAFGMRAPEVGAAVELRAQDNQIGLSVSSNGGVLEIGAFGSPRVPRPMIAGDWNSGAPVDLAAFVGALIEAMASLGWVQDARSNT